MPHARTTDTTDRLQGERVAFLGRLAGMTRRDAPRVVRCHAGLPVEPDDPALTLLVVGEEELPLGDAAADDSPLDEATRRAAERGTLTIIRESQFWERLGFVEAEQNVRRLYTPAMLADLLGVSVAVIRRWHRKGLIVPAHQVRRLPYFDFAEVATARRLAELLAAGCSATTIEKKLANLARYLPGVERPLAQLSIIVEGKQLLLRQGDGLIEPGGQFRFDFEASPPDDSPAGVDEPAEERHIVSLAEPTQPIAPDEILELAGDLEDRGQLEAAAETYRAALAASGPRAEINFALAELLYRLGDRSAARERYYASIELDEDYVEARANLGCVLAELDQHELAVAAFEGALRYHHDYPDVHYHLASELDALDRHDEAEEHWHAFLALAPDSPWADKARERLDQESG